jgi:hypothetical protein
MGSKLSLGVVSLLMKKHMKLRLLVYMLVEIVFVELIWLLQLHMTAVKLLEV